MRYYVNTVAELCNNKLDELKLYMSYINLVNAIEKVRVRQYIQVFGEPNLNKRIYSETIWSEISTEQRIRMVENEYRKFASKNKYGRIATPRGQVSIPRIQCSTGNGNNIKYDSRRIFDDMGK